MNLGRKFELSISPNTKGAVMIVNNIDGGCASKFLKPLANVVKKFEEKNVHPTKCFFEFMSEEQIEEMRAMLPKINIYG